jgi:hypothetical protein
MSGAAAAGEEAVRSPTREWWLRTLLVLGSPRDVFLALRDDSEAQASARAEPVLLVLWLAGIAAVLSTATAGHLLDDQDYDGLLVAVWTFLAGGLYGGFAYWAFGGALHGGLKALGSEGSYRRSRQLLAFAVVPVAASLVLWPVKLALYGEDLFRRGGSDAHAGGAAFGVLSALFLFWALGLLVLGVRTVQDWSWGRSAGAVAAAAVLPLLLLLAFSSL